MRINILSDQPEYQWEILIWLLSWMILPRLICRKSALNWRIIIFVEFAQIVCKDTIRMRVWERGSGITQACGTGACATAVAAFINELTGRKSDIIMDGGTVTIEWDEASGHILMTGPATKVFDGEIEEIEG